MSAVDLNSLGVKVSRAQDCSKSLVSKGRFFYDEHNRALLLRGVNLCGNSKLPTIKGPEGFFDHQNVSFIGRPFPLNEAKEHFGRLRAWGLTFTRVLVTWEALEHKGPGEYDDAFIDYLIQILNIANDFGIKCFIDPHQDCWSRYSGGSGAPGWTFEAVGLDVRHLTETGAAIVYKTPEEIEPRMNLWPTNYSKLGSATMFTVFFGGNIFCPNKKVDGVPIQDYLQSHYIKCYQYLAQKLYKHPAVVGFEVMNEPHYGYIGLESLHSFDPIAFLHLGDMPSALQSFALADGNALNVDYYVKSWPWPSRKGGVHLVNEHRKKAWKQGCIWKDHGLWTMGKDGKPKVLVDDYFSKHPATGNPVDFDQDCYLPFILKYTQAIRQVDPDLWVFFEPIPNEDPPVVSVNDPNSEKLVYAPHWYDLKALFTKSFNGLVTHDVQGLSRGTKNILAATYFGIAGAKENYRGQIRKIVNTGNTLVGERPLLIGECGIPMDINEKSAFETGDYTHHNNFLDAVIGAMEANLVNFTLWNYNPVNDNQFGDHWNGEDFSIFSPQNSPRKNKSGTHTPRALLKSSDSLKKESKLSLLISTEQKVESSRDNLKTPITPVSPFEITEALIHEGDKGHHHHRGGRALDAMIRPYASKVAGQPLFSQFDRQLLEYTFEMVTIQSDLQIDSSNWRSFATEVFIPNYHYGDVQKPVIEVSDGVFKYDKEKQTLLWIYDPEFKGQRLEQAVNRIMFKDGEVKHKIVIRHPKPPVRLSLVQKLFKWIIDTLCYYLG